MIITAKSYPRSIEPANNKEFERTLVNSFVVVVASALVIATTLITGVFYLIEFLVHR